MEVTTNEGSLNTTSHTFTENGSFEFIATDEAGNVTSKVVTITNIDKAAPIITLSDYETGPTQGPITISASTNEGTLNATSHTFTENGSFDFIATDEAGNVTSKVVTISNIITAQNQVESFVSRFYELVLNRTTDPWGLNDWTTKLLNGERSGADVAYGFVFSDEFKDRGVSDEQYVNIMYEAFFNRSADAGGYANWMDALSKGMSRYYVLRGFTDSQEFKDLASSYGINPGSLVLSQPADLYPDITAFVTRFYKETLNRMPDEGGLNDWVNQLQKKTRTGADVAYGFIFSDEFKAKNLNNDLFVRTLYSAFFGREADEGGYNDWMNRLASGQTREQVLKGFLGSAEFRDLCTKYGITVGDLSLIPEPSPTLFTRYDSTNFNLVLESTYSNFVVESRCILDGSSSIVDTITHQTATTRQLNGSIYFVASFDLSQSIIDNCAYGTMLFRAASVSDLLNINYQDLQWTNVQEMYVSKDDYLNLFQTKMFVSVDLDGTLHTNISNGMFVRADISTFEDGSDVDYSYGMDNVTFISDLMNIKDMLSSLFSSSYIPENFSLDNDKFLCYAVYDLNDWDYGSYMHRKCEPFELQSVQLLLTQTHGKRDSVNFARNWMNHVFNNTFEIEIRIPVLSQDIYTYNGPFSLSTEPYYDYHIDFKSILGPQLNLNEDTPESFEMEISIIAIGDYRYQDSIPYEYTINISKSIFE